MSNHMFSPSKAAFYSEEHKEAYIAAENWPDDLIPVSDEVLSKFVGVCPEGKVLGADANGEPKWVNAPTPTKEDNVTKRDMLLQNVVAIINNNQWVGRLALGRISDDDKALYVSWLDYMDALEKIDLDDPQWPEQPE